jgi:hypothetical protein
MTQSLSIVEDFLSFPGDQSLHLQCPLISGHVIGLRKQEGWSLLLTSKSWNNPEESPHLREEGAKLALVFGK